MPNLHRRSYLKGVTGVAGSVVALSAFARVSDARGDAVSATTVRQTDTVPLSQVTGAPSAHALLCETDLDGQYTAEMHLDGDPSGTQCVSESGQSDGLDGNQRDGVVHVTTNGNRTTDYAHGLVNLRDRFDHPLTLGVLQDGVDVSFDYYEGPDNERAAPDEVFVVIEGDVRSLDDLATKLYQVSAFVDLSATTKVQVDERFREQFDAPYSSLHTLASDAYSEESFTDLSAATQTLVAQVYRSQFKKGLTKYSKNEIANLPRYDTDFDELTPTQQAAVTSLYQSQFVVVPLPKPAQSLDDIAQAEFDSDFADLSTTSKVTVTETYRSQFAVPSHSLDEIAGIFGQTSYADLSEPRRDVVLHVFRQQFVDEKRTSEDFLGGEANVTTDQSEQLYRAQFVGAKTVRTFMSVKHINDGVDPDPASVACSDDNKHFRTQNVTDTLFSGQTWRDVEISMQNFLTGQAVISLARALRDRGISYTDPLERYGENARLVAVGFGAGFTTTPTVVDRYYDNLLVQDTRESPENPFEATSFDFPAAVPANTRIRPQVINTRSNGRVTIDITLQQEERGINPTDVDPASVRLSQFSPVSPPVEMGVQAESVQVRPNGTIRARFTTESISETFEAGEHRVIVSGLFDVPQRVTFVAVGTFTVQSPPDNAAGNGGNGNEDSQSSSDTSSNGQGAGASSNSGPSGFITSFLESFGFSWG